MSIEQIIEMVVVEFSELWALVDWESDLLLFLGCGRFCCFAGLAGWKKEAG